MSLQFDDPANRPCPLFVGRVFREFAVTIAVAIIVSGFVSLTLTPMLCARVLRK